MKSLYNILTIFALSIVVSSCNNETTPVQRKAINHTIILDLSDRILTPNQLEKDFQLITTFFNDFEKTSRRNLVVTSNDCFTVKIIPQKNSPLNVNHFEDLLQIHLDELPACDKNKSLVALSQSLPKVLQSLKKEALFGKVSKNYFGVDIWAYLHDNGKGLSKPNYDNTILVLTDGYFDFENQAHVIKEKNQYTSTHFLNELTDPNWLRTAEAKQYGLLPIVLDKNTKWIVAGFSGKKATDILQTEKITYFWKKWLTESGVTASQFILNSSKTEMSSKLLQQIQ